jgi:hypothetical protein
MPAQRGNTVAAIVSYAPGPGPTQITVRYMRTPHDSPGIPQVVDQGDQEVEVLISYDGSDNIEGLSEHALVIDLDAPLGERVVVDDAHQPVMLVGLSTEESP